MGKFVEAKKLRKEKLPDQLISTHRKTRTFLFKKSLGRGSRIKQIGINANVDFLRLCNGGQGNFFF